MEWHIKQYVENKKKKADIICCYCNKQVHDREGIAVIQYVFCRLWYSHSIIWNLEVKALMCMHVSVLLCAAIVPCTSKSQFSFLGGSMQLPIFHADKCSSAVILLSSGVSAASLSLIRYNLVLLSSGISAASLSHLLYPHFHLFGGLSCHSIFYLL